MIDITQYGVDGLNEEVSIREYKKIANKLLNNIESPPLPLEYILNRNSASIITFFRTQALQNYNKEEFSHRIPKELRPLIEREPALMEGLEVEYHNKRTNYIKNLSKEIEKDPLILKNYENILLSFFFRTLAFPKEPPEANSNAALQIMQLKSNLFDLYMLLSTKKFGFKEYVLGIGDDGKIYSKLANKLNNIDDIFFYYDALHSHAVTFLNFNPKNFQEIIPDKAVWASNLTRFKGISNKYDGTTGIDMFLSGLNNKHFHSSLPHDIIINNLIKKITIKNAPSKQISFCNHFLDGTISFGVMNLIEDKILAYTSDVAADFFQDSIISTKGPNFLLDLTGCIARDMFVLEERNKFYNISEVKAKSEKIRQKKKIEEKIIWLPRFRIDFDRKVNDNNLEDKLIKLSPCHVSGHPRKCENPSEKQIELAEKFGVKLPPGFTYVREYDKSGSKEFVRSYKSRSAMQLIYGS